MFSKQPLWVLQPGAGEVDVAAPATSNFSLKSSFSPHERSRLCASALFQLKIKALKLNFVTYVHVNSYYITTVIKLFRKRFEMSCSFKDLKVLLRIQLG